MHFKNMDELNAATDKVKELELKFAGFFMSLSKGIERAISHYRKKTDYKIDLLNTFEIKLGCNYKRHFIRDDGAAFVSWDGQESEDSKVIVYPAEIVNAFMICYPAAFEAVVVEHCKRLTDEHRDKRIANAIKLLTENGYEVTEHD